MITEDRQWNLKNFANVPNDEFMRILDRANSIREDLSVEDCEWLISVFPEQPEILKKLAVVAGRAFRASCVDQEVDDTMAQHIAAGELSPYLATNYPTLRKALYLAQEMRLQQEIHNALKDKYPWGLK